MASSSHNSWLIAVACIAMLPGLPDAMAAAAGGAVIPDDREAVQLTLRFSRAELDSAAGARRVYARLVAQAVRTCRMPGAPAHQLRAVDQGCAAHLVEQAVTRIASPLLAGQHAGRAQAQWRDGVVRGRN